MSNDVTIAALAIVPGPDDTVTFVRQQRGPYAGSLLLPGGKLEFGETASEAARRETFEEAGCMPGELSPVSLYELRGTARDIPYHFIMFTFLARGEERIHTDFSGHHVDGVLQARPDDVRPHPTVQRILNDSGVGRYDEAAIDDQLARGGITMTSFAIATERSLHG